MPTSKTTDLCVMDKFQECALRLGVKDKGKFDFYVVYGVWIKSLLPWTPVSMIQPSNMRQFYSLKAALIIMGWEKPFHLSHLEEEGMAHDITLILQFA